MYNYVKQISVFLPNETGSLAAFTKVLAENGVDMLALSIADTASFGILRVIVPKFEYALDVLKKAGYTANLTAVIAVSVPDKPGGFHRALQVLNDAGVGVEYLYSFVRNVEGRAVLILRVDKAEEALEKLREANVDVLSREQVQEM